MGAVTITLPDELIQDAEQAGLLASAAMEDILRKQLRARALQDLLTMMDKIQAVPDPNPMTPEEVAEEIRAMRAERRA